MAFSLIQKVNDLVGDVNFIPYNIDDIVVMVGAPAIPLKGIEYVWAEYSAPRVGQIKSLNAKSVFVSNNNTTGIMEIGLLAGDASNAAIEVLEMTGIPYPITFADGATGGTSFANGMRCRLISTPRWRREALPGVNVYTFGVGGLTTSHGARLAE